MLSVATWCDVQGSRPDTTRPVAHLCSVPMASLPDWVVATGRLDPEALSNQSIFNWVDLRSYDIRVAGVSKQAACFHQLEHPLTALSYPPGQGYGFDSADILGW
jgi:hypothetical protein